MALTKTGTDGIKDDAITLDKLAHGTSSQDGKFLRANSGAAPTFETVTGTTINNNADNRIITGSGTANTLEGEANLTFSSNTLTVHEASLKGNQLLFGPSGTAYIDHSTTGQDIQYRTSVSSSQDTTGPTIKSNGRVGIGTTSPTDKLHVVGTTNLAGNSYLTNAYVSGNIYLGGTGSANALDDYEEGSFTPTLTTQNSALSASYNTQEGKYTKIGNFVHVQVYIRLSSRSGGSGQLRISNLPFAASNESGAAYGGGVVAYTYNWANDKLDRCMIGSNSTALQLFIGTSSGTNVNAGSGNLNNDTQIRVFGSYRV